MIRTSTLLLLASVAISAACAIVAAHRDDRAGVYVFKPATTLIILIGATWLIVPAPPLYRSLIVVGLALSLAGDVLLMLPGRFAAGLVAFLVAHLAYLAAFSYGNPVTLRQLVWLLPFLAFGTAVVANRWSALGSLRVAVLIYAAVICTVGWRAAMRGQAVFIPRQSYLFALFGACLFLVSDAIVLLRRFGRPFPAAQSLELSTYWVAQSLIALSIRA